MVKEGNGPERLPHYLRSENEWTSNGVGGVGPLMMLDCMTCKWIKWSASIPLILLLSAGGFVAFAQFAEARDDAPIALLNLYLATWSYVLALAGTVLLASWWLWRWLHMRRSHALRPC